MLNPQGETESGDIFCLAWYPKLNTLYLGCQNTSLQWYTFTPTPPKTSNGPAGLTLPSNPSIPSLEYLVLDSLPGSGASTPRRAHKFFDSYPQYERKPADLNARNPTCSSCSTPPSPPGASTPHIITDDSCLQQHDIPTPERNLQVPPENMIWSAHYGYVYCMALVPSRYEGSDDPPLGSEHNAQLATGSGDSTVKVSRSRHSPLPAVELTRS